MSEARDMVAAASMAREAAGDLTRAAREVKGSNDSISWNLQALREERVLLEKVVLDLRDEHPSVDLARRFLATLGKSDHPSAATDPVSALGQVAVDLQTALTLHLSGASVHRADGLPPSITLDHTDPNATIP